MWYRSLCLFICVVACGLVSRAIAQPAPISMSFDFRNGSLGWQVGFARWSPMSWRPGDPYPLLAEIRSLPTELGNNGTGFYVQGSNYSDALIIFLKRRLSADDGIVTGQTYQVSFAVVFASSRQSGCGGTGGSPGDRVDLSVGGSPAEPCS